MNSGASAVNQPSSKPRSQVSPAPPTVSQSPGHSPAAERSPCPPSGSAAMTQSADSSAPHQPSDHPITAAAPPPSSQPSSPSPDTAPPPATGATPVSSVETSPVTCNSATMLSPSAAAVHARFGRTSKYATKDSPRMLGVKCVVDFEKIYRYLSAIHKPDRECNLTPMGKTFPHHSYKLKPWAEVGRRQTFRLTNVSILLTDMTGNRSLKMCRCFSE